MTTTRLRVLNGAGALLAHISTGCSGELSIEESTLATSQSRLEESIQSQIAEGVATAEGAQLLSWNVAEQQVPDAPISAKDYSYWEQQQRKFGAFVDTTTQPTSTEQALKLAEAWPSGEPFPLMVTLDDPGFDFLRLREAKSAATPEEAAELRERIIDERRQQLAEAGQVAVQQRLIRLGAEVTSPYWIDNSIYTEVPAALIPTIVKWSEVVRIGYVDPTPHALDANGQLLKDNTLAINLVQAGYDGRDGSQNAFNWPNVTLGIIESVGPTYENGFLRKDHPVFRVSDTDYSSRALLYYCPSNYCLYDSVSLGTADNQVLRSHSTTVAWVAAGSIRRNIDPNYPGSWTLAQQRRSGVALKTRIVNYLHHGDASFKHAIDTAVQHGVDIINHSASSYTLCDGSNESDDPAGLNGAIQQAQQAGVLIVNSAGNSHTINATCSLTHPVWRPEVLTVGAIDTPDATTLESGFLATYSGRGWVRVGVESGSLRTFSHPSVALTAHGSVELYPNSPTGYDTGTDRTGTSFAAPVVAGSAALLLNSFKDSAFTNSYSKSAEQLFTNMLLMGDSWYTSWNGDLDETWGLEQSPLDEPASPSSGFGKLYMHFPLLSDPSMIPPWKWSIPVARTVYQGTSTWWPANPDASFVNYPMPAEATQLKWAFTYFPTDMNDYGSIATEIVEAPCDTADPVSVGTVRAYDHTNSSRKRLQLFDIAGKCIWLVAKPFYTPGSSVVVHNAYYYHSGDTRFH